MTTAPVVTVGIPFFNEEQHLAAAIRSILFQSWTDLEILLVDDGSTDDSLKIARSFQDARITVLADGHRRFLPARLNEIVAHARGRFVARMDADDISHPDRLARQLAILNGDVAIAAVGSWVALIDEKETPFAIVEATRSPNPAIALRSGILPHATLVARRAWLIDNPYDEALTRAEDRDLWCRTVETSRFHVVEEPLYTVRVIPTQSTFLADYRESQRQNRILYRRYGPRAVGRGRMWREWVGSFAKARIMGAALRFGVVDHLVRRRGRPPTIGELEMISQTLANNDRQRP